MDRQEVHISLLDLQLKLLLLSCINFTCPSSISQFYRTHNKDDNPHLFQHFYSISTCFGSLPTNINVKDSLPIFIAVWQVLLHVCVLHILKPATKTTTCIAFNISVSHLETIPLFSLQQAPCAIHHVNCFKYIARNY